MNMTFKNAAHEIGHFLFAHRHEVPSRYISVLEGSDILPHFRLVEGTLVTNEVYLEIMLGGWASEAYIMSHGRQAKRFRPRLFAIATRLTGWGSGWRRGLTGKGSTDIAALVRFGISLEALRDAQTLLLKMGAVIHEDRSRYFLLIDRLLAQRGFLSADVASLLHSGVPWTTKLAAVNDSSRFDFDYREPSPSDDRPE
ncbi:hypothetical protein GOD96_18745 [Sinorhizobium medicae]|nr:hypothetical protein [Sinorhizobium medicae]